MKEKTQSVRVTWLAIALLPLWAGAASRQSEEPSPQSQAAAPAPAQLRLDKAQDLIGAKVVNDKCEQVGTVQDIVLNPDHDTISYVALARGWTWGVPQTYVAVPWSQFGTGTQEGRTVLVLNGVSPAQVEQAPGFTRNHWPAVASANWLGTGVGPAVAPWAPAAEIRQRRLSKLLDTTVRNLQGTDLGDLKNALVDMNRGKLAFGIVEISRGFLGLNKEYAPVPWQTLDFTGPGIARLNADRQTLLAMASNEDNFPSLRNPRYSMQVYERFGAMPYWEALGYIPAEPQADTAGGSGQSQANAQESAEHPAQPADTAPR